MNAAQLAVSDAADRVRVLARAIAETRRGIELRVARGACTVEPLRRNLARLETEHAAAQIRLALAAAKYVHEISCVYTVRQRTVNA